MIMIFAEKLAPGICVTMVRVNVFWRVFLKKKKGKKKYK